MSTLLGRLLCRLGWHDDYIVSILGSHGGPGVIRRRCRRCGRGEVEVYG